jgi:CheY-like chemotaxis protein
MLLVVERRAPKARPKPVPAAEAQPPAMTSLLLVEDDEFVRRALTRALNRTGVFAVLAAENGAHALDLLAERPVDAILTDLQMPVMDGLTFLSHLLEQGSRVPVAVMTGQRITPDLADRLRQFGIAATFTKPVDISALVDDLQRSVTPGTVGRIAGITLFGFLQLLEVERKTGLVVVHAAGTEGRLYFQRGELVHGETRGLKGMAAVYEIVSWPDPKLELFYKRTPRERTITEPLQYVLMEAARLEDERGAAEDGDSDAPESPGARDPGVTREGVQAALEEAMQIEGALGVALVDGASGMTLASAGGKRVLNWEVAGAGAADSLRAQRRVMEGLGLEDAIEDIMITLGTQYHVVRCLGRDSAAFLYLVLTREAANLGMARHTLARLARELTPQR